jgi:RNA polymerase sigma factor (sigma-70 family)
MRPAQASNLARSRVFYSTAYHQNVTPWPVLSPISALRDRNTFVPTQKTDALARYQNLNRKIMKPTDLIKDSFNQSPWQRGFLQNASETKDFESEPKIVELASFEETMLPHLDAAHNLARWLLRNEQDAQDVVQEAYLRAFKSFDGFHGSNGGAWLLTIVRNTSYTFLKQHKAVDLTTPFDDEIHAIRHESTSPATILEHAEDTELMRNAIDKLPAEFREILILRHQEGLAYKEIADIAQLAPGTVMSRLARARAKLREYFVAEIGNEK